MKLTSLVVVSALLGYGHHQANAVNVQSMNKGQSRSTASLRSNIMARTGVMSLADCESEFQRSGIVLAECQQFIQNASTMKPEPLAAPQVLAQPGLPTNVAAQAEMVHPFAAGTESLSQAPVDTHVWDNSNMAAQAQAPVPEFAAAQPQAQPAVTTLGQSTLQAAPIAQETMATTAPQQTLMQQPMEAQAQIQAPAQPAQTDVWGLAQRAGPAPTAIAQQSSIPMAAPAPQQLMQAPATYAAPLMAAPVQVAQAAPVQAAPVAAAQPVAQAAPVQAAAQVEPERPQRDKQLPQKHNPDSTDLTQTKAKEDRLKKQENQAKVGQAVSASKDLCDACGAICNIDDLAQLFADIIEETEDDGEIGTSDILNMVKKANTCVSVQKILMKLPKSKRPDPADVPPVAPQPGDPADLTVYTNRVPCICGISQGVLDDAEELIKDTYTVDVTVNINRKTGVAIIKDKSGKILDKYSAFAVEAITNVIQTIDKSDQGSIDAVKVVKQVKQVLDTDTGPTDGSGVPTMGMGSGGMGGMGMGGGGGCCGCCSCGCGGGKKKSSMSDDSDSDDDSN